MSFGQGRLSHFGGHNASQSQSQQTFSFPTLSSAEILATWDEVPLQAKDLEKPTAASVRAVYEVLCDSTIGPMAREEINCPQEEALGHIEYPELHEDSIPQLTFFRYVSRLLAAAGVYDTNMSDILKPDPKRFKRNLCAIINFQKFRQERLESFEKLHLELASLCDEKAALDEECAAIEGKIQAIQDQREAELPQVEKLREGCRGLENELKAREKEHANLQNELKRLKARSNELKDYLATLRFQKLNLAQECEKLEKNIVRSPERLKTELAEQRRQLDVDREENARLDNQADELGRNVANLERAETQSNSLLGLLKRVEEGMLECKEAAKDTKQMTASVKEHGNTIRGLETQKAEVERQIEIAQDRLSRLDKTKALKIAAANHALCEGRDEREQLSKQNVDLKHETRAEHEAIDRLEDEITTQRDTFEAAFSKRRAAFQRLETVISQSSEALFERLSCA